MSAFGMAWLEGLKGCGIAALAVCRVLCRGEVSAYGIIRFEIQKR